MTQEQIQSALDEFIRARTRYVFIQQIEQNFQREFNALSKEYRTAYKRRRDEIRPQMRRAWWILRAAMRCRIVYVTDTEAALLKLENALQLLGERLGEHLPDQYEATLPKSLL